MTMPTCQQLVALILLLYSCVSNSVRATSQLGENSKDIARVHSSDVPLDEHQCLFSMESQVFFNDTAIAIDLPMRRASVSANGNTIAFQWCDEVDEFVFICKLRIMRFHPSLNIWKPMGKDVPMHNLGSHSKTHVSLNRDGSVMAILEHHNITVFEFQQDSVLWSQVGPTFHQPLTSENYGNHISLSDDGLTLAYANSKRASYVFYFNHKENQWQRRGQFIMPTYDLTFSSDGSMLATAPLGSLFEFQENDWAEVTNHYELEPYGRYAEISFDADKIRLAKYGGVGSSAKTLEVRVYELDPIAKVWLPISNVLQIDKAAYGIVYSPEEGGYGKEYWFTRDSSLVITVTNTTAVFWLQEANAGELAPWTRSGASTRLPLTHAKVSRDGVVVSFSQNVDMVHVMRQRGLPCHDTHDSTSSPPSNGSTTERQHHPGRNGRAFAIPLFLLSILLVILLKRKISSTRYNTCDHSSLPQDEEIVEPHFELTCTTGDAKHTLEENNC